MSSIKANQIKMVPIGELKPNPENTNRHSVEQLIRLEKIIKAQGFRTPVTVSNRSGLVVCGHARLDVAKKIGMQVVPVMYQDFKDEKEEYAHLNADNEIARWAELDLHSVHEKIKLFDDFDIELLGIENFKIEEPEEDVTPEGSGEPKQEKIFFTVSHDQKDTIREALDHVQGRYKDSFMSDLNDDKDGNALAYLCELFMTQEKRI